MKEISDQFGAIAFVLVGRDRIVNYPNRRIAHTDERSIELPFLADTENPVIADMRPLNRTGHLQRTQGHWSPIGGINYTFFYREPDSYGPELLTIGMAIPSADTRRER